ncbi:CdaR family transcriptional regulator [Streptomyces sp. TS71-3]|uniref:PucR family transcriptional regulator n=1 Tax=Streptomyces sp. TS71-3 TaxID=2733862 RepID=UPI001BB41CAD|nr:helix-turn-helix domain-containing protein [Streptomyces sp. TS71-3]
MTVVSEVETGVQACSTPDVPGMQDSGAAWVDRISDVITCEITEDAFPARRGSVPFHNGLRRFVRTNVLTVARAHNAGTPPGKEADRSVREFGAWVAEQGFPATSIRSAYWAGTRQLIGRWGEMGWPGLVTGRCPGDGRPGVSGEAVSQVAALAFEFAERAMRVSTRAHQEATAELGLDGDLRRRAVVGTILAAPDAAAGAPADPAWDALLGYRLGGTHVGVLLEATHRAQVDAVLRQAQSLTGARERLLLPPDTSQWTAWLGYRKAPPAGTLDALCAALRDSGLRAAVGRPHQGVAGFRMTHREALRAAGVRGKLAAAPMCISFGDVSLEDLLLHDPSLVAAFVNDELGPLADGTDRAARMRETLSVWLSCGTHTATATRLGIHENTVRLRLNSVAEALGPRYLERKTELLVALRLSDALAISGS